MKISVCMIVKNEEKHLQRALQSVPQHYEIIVTDTGSSDGTVAMAIQYGAKIYEYVWNNDFAAARNFCASWATGDYILVMDADEELPSDTDERIQQFVAQYPRSAGCVFINNVMNSEMKKHRMVRFYPNDPSFYFEGTVHEQVYLGGEPAFFEKLSLEVLHYGYEEEEYRSKNKAERYLSMYKAHLAEHPNDGYMLYQMGKLYFSLNEWETAEEYLWQSYSQKQQNRLYYPVMLVMLGYVLKEQNHTQDALALLQPFEMIYAEFPDLFFLLGLLAMDSGDLQAVEHYFTQALTIGETERYVTVDGVGTFKAAYNLGLFYEFTGNADLSQQCYRFAAEYEYRPALQRLK
jgi:glycosyltransferase involved in cell wall biosynthesis